MSGSLWVSDGGQAWQWAGPGALSDEQHQGLLIWCELRPWHSLTKEDRFAVIKHICSPWGRRRAVGVPHPLKGRGPEDALRWVDRLIVSVFRWGEQGFHGEMAGRSTGPPWRVHNWCVRISLMMSRCDTALSSLPDVYHVVFLSSRINTDNPHSISPVLILFPHCVCAHIKARDGCKLPSEQSHWGCECVMAEPPSSRSLTGQWWFCVVQPVCSGSRRVAQCCVCGCWPLHFAGGH